MPPAPFLRALAAACVLLLCAPTWGGADEAVPAPPHSDGGAAGLDEARALVDTGRFQEALALLRPLLEADAIEANTLFLYGLAAAGSSQQPGIPGDTREALLDEAIAAFRKMLVANPGLVRVRLELARAFFLKGEDSLAKRHFEQVLAGKPPAGVALNVNRFLAAIRARKRWSVRVGVALSPDTNIGAVSEDDTIWVSVFGQRLPFTLDQPAQKDSGVGLSVWAGGEYQYPLADRWRLRAGGDISRREYQASEFDQINLSGHVGPRWLVGRGSEASLLLSGLHRWTGAGLEEPSHHDIGLRVEGRHRLGPRTTVDAQASRHERRYDERTHLDGPVTDVFVGAQWVASPTVRIDAGLGWGWERPETELWRHTRRLVRLGVTAALARGFTVGASGSLRWTDYEGNYYPTEDERPRSDITRSLRLSAHHRGFTLGGFSPQVSLVIEERTSNEQLRDYDRIFGELRFVRLF